MGNYGDGSRNAEIKDEETLQRSGTEGGSGNAAFGFFELKALPSGL